METRKSSTFDNVFKYDSSNSILYTNETLCQAVHQTCVNLMDMLYDNYQIKVAYSRSEHQLSLLTPDEEYNIIFRHIYEACANTIYAVKNDFSNNYKPSIFDRNYKDEIIWEYAMDLCKQISSSIIDELRNTPPQLFEDNLYKLTSIWDEICVASHTPAAPNLDADYFSYDRWYDCCDLLKKHIRQKIENLSTEKQLCIYNICFDKYQYPEDTIDLDASDVDVDCIVEYIIHNYIYHMAYEYETESIYYARCDIC